MKPICIKCHRFFRMRKGGYYFTEGMPRVTPARPGLVDADLWKPYKIWAADLWECEGCHVQILSGFSASALSEHYRDDFQDLREKLHADQFQVNDC